MNDRIRTIRSLDLYDQRLAGKPDMIRDHCIFCGRKRTNEHHLIPKSRLPKGYMDSDAISPRLSVCGQGNASGCHGKLHTGRLFVDWVDEEGCYAYLVSREPISRAKAYNSTGWALIPWERM